jgi:hypothetical protein
MIVANLDGLTIHSTVNLDFAPWPDEVIKLIRSRNVRFWFL